MKKLISFVTVGLLAFGLFAQESVKSLEEEYYDYLSLVGEVERPTLHYRSFSDSVWNIQDDVVHPWMENNLGTTFKFIDLSDKADSGYLKGAKPWLSIRYYGPDWYNSYNTKMPSGQNDGGLWQGVGYNTALTGGIHFEAFGFEATFKPQLSFSQNKAFDYLQGYGNPYNDHYYSAGGVCYIDLVQRFGDKAFFNFDWGDSEVRYTFNNMTIGFGTSNPWIGPSYLNPMLGSNNASAYPKLDIGLKRTQIIFPNGYYLGDIEARAFTGMLFESKYYDNNSKNDKRMLNALFVGISPSFIPGLTLGASRVILTGWDIKNLKYFPRLFYYSKANDVYGPGEDQKMSLTFDWLFPSVGFEIYGEYGMDDFAWKKLVEPFRTVIYSAGLKKDIPLWPAARDANVRSELVFECGNYEISRDFFVQGWGYGGYYSHDKIGQGYTSNGQLLGSAYGYSGNTQYLAYNVYYPNGKTGIFIHRHVPDSNYIFSKVPHEESLEGYYSSYITNIDVGIDTSFFATKSLIVSGNATFNYIINPKYVRDDKIYNFHLMFGVKYNI